MASQGEQETWERYVREANRPVGNLYLDIRLEKEVVKSNEDVNLEVKLCNVGAKDLYIPFDLARNPLKLCVFDPDNTTFVYKSAETRPPVGEFVPYTRIAPGCFVGTRIPILLSRSNVPPGRYYVMVSYQSDTERSLLAPEVEGVEVLLWRGLCRSKVLELRIQKGRAKR